MTEKPIPGLEAVKDRLTEEYVLAYMYQHMPVASGIDIGMMAYNSGLTDDRSPSITKTNEVTEALLCAGHITDVKAAFELPAHGGEFGLRVERENAEECSLPFSLFTSENTGNFQVLSRIEELLPTLLPCI